MENTASIITHVSSAKKTPIGKKCIFYEKGRGALKKLGALVIIVLILIVIWKSGWLDDERVISALETGVRTALGWLEQGFAFVIEKLKP